MLPSRNAVFVDTSGWVEPVLHSGPNHDSMMRYAQALHTDQRPLVTTDDVLNEVVALLTTDSRGMPRSMLIQFVNQIRANGGLCIWQVEGTSFLIEHPRQRDTVSENGWLAIALME